MSKWFLYIVRCSDCSLYTGITTDVAARVKTHNAGKGAKYTRSRLPVKLVYKKAIRSESLARQREAAIKKWPRFKKELLILDSTV